MTHNAPAHARPGQPEGKWWHPFAYLGALFGLAGVGWALIAGSVWLLWVTRIYVAVMFSITFSLAIIALVAWLALKRGWRPKMLAASIFLVLVVMILSALPQ